MRIVQSVVLASALAMTVSVDAGDTSTTGAATSGTHATDAAGSHSNAELQTLTTPQFFDSAAAASMKEVHVSELALRNSQSESIKAFARRMISEHTRQNTQLATLAARNDVSLPKDLPEKEQGEVERLRVEKGATFDTAFTERMKADHESAIALYQRCAAGTQISKSVRTFCRTNVATLKQHSQAVHALELRSNITRAPAVDE